MSAYAAYVGYPSFCNALRRSRVTTLIGASGDRPCVVCGPSGSGKTVAASHFAEAQALPTLWVVANGQAPSLGQLMRSLLDLLGCTCADAVDNESELIRECRLGLAQRFPDGALLVLDDVGKSCDAATLANSIHQQLRHLRVNVLITTRRSVARAEVHVVDQGLLYFSKSELQQAARGLDRNDLSLGTLEDIRVACGGHPALATMLLASVSSDGEIVDARNAIGPLIDRVVATSFSSVQSELFELLRTVRRAHIEELPSVGFHDAASDILAMSRCLPLITLQREAGRSVVAVHDLALHDMCDAHIDEIGDAGDIVRLVASSGDPDRLESVLCRGSMRQAALEWLERSELSSVVATLGRQRVLNVVDSLPLEMIVVRPKVMLLWATVLYDSGRLTEAVAKARVALSLARHDNDARLQASSGAVLIRALSYTNRSGEGYRLGEELLKAPAAQRDTVSNCLLSCATVLAAAGAYRSSDVDRIWARVSALSQGDPNVVRAMREIETTRAHLLGYMSGDWTRVAKLMMPLINSDQTDEFTTRVKRRGNVASCLIMRGRLSRAESLLATILRKGDEFADGTYLPTLGMLRAGAGRTEEGVSLFGEGMTIVASSGDEMDYAHDRIYLAILQRAANLLEDSLISAERAHECLTEFGFPHLAQAAAVETGASILALGDVRAARAWTEPVLPLNGDNGYEALRAAMVLAECDRRDGDLVAAIERLGQHVDQIRSENSNWQMAMYCRTFPHLLALLASAAGARDLPVHMLRMILPEHAEPAMRAAEEILPADEWRLLGRRLLGDDQFDEFIERKGRPMCRVRMFGGLDVVIDDRVVHERDWAKRKGRSVFAMLVARRGQELPRDQILEHLWPDMDATRAKNNFYVAWSSMKAAIKLDGEEAGECPFVDNARGRCRIVRDRLRSDLDDFEDLMTEARTADAEGRPKDALVALGRLMTVYRGDLLAGDLYDDWFAPLREKYRIEFLDSMLRATELALALNDPNEAIMFARRGVSVDPFREDLYQAALRCHIQAGQRSAAIETFLQCKIQLADELGLDPSTDTVKLYEQVLAMEERSRYDAGLGAFPSQTDFD